MESVKGKKVVRVGQSTLLRLALRVTRDTYARESGVGVSMWSVFSYLSQDGRREHQLCMRQRIVVGLWVQDALMRCGEGKC